MQSLVQDVPQPQHADKKLKYTCPVLVLFPKQLLLTLARDRIIGQMDLGYDSLESLAVSLRHKVNSDVTRDINGVWKSFCKYSSIEADNKGKGCFTAQGIKGYTNSTPAEEFNLFFSHYLTQISYCSYSSYCRKRAS